MKIYLIGSLRNPTIPELGVALRALGHEVFDDWHGAGPEADDYWQKYEQERGRDYLSALHGFAASNVFEFDMRHLDSAAAAVLVLPAGKSAHLELGYMRGRGAWTAVLFDSEPDRWDVMYRLADAQFFSIESLLEAIDATTLLP
jgi:hypothetical protein